MPGLPTVTDFELINALQKAGFEIVRQRGSYIRMQHEDARVVTIPTHAGKTLGKGLLRKIFRDAELTVEELITLLD